MALATNMSQIAEYLVTLINTNRVSLGVDNVYYGDQQKLDAGVIVCVEPDEKVRILKGATRRTDLTFTLQIFVYHSLLQSPITSRKQNDICAEAVETLIHSYPRLGGLAIHSLVTTIQSGVVTKSNSLVRASRLQFEAKSEQILPNQEA